MDVILLGAPGAGKGTQAKALEEHSGLVHVASGDLFRSALRQGTELGMLAKSYMDRGELVPDEVVIRMIMERIAQPDCQRGVIFDGFPRTIDQVAALTVELERQGRDLRAVLFLKVPEAMLLRRIAGRETCKTCGSTYNVYYFPSKRPDVCDECGGRLYQRNDDNMETAQRRLGIYFAQTLPLIDHYRTQGLLREIDGQREITQVTQDMLHVMESNGSHA
jgi:adenylate kinase